MSIAASAGATSWARRQTGGPPADVYVVLPGPPAGSIAKSTISICGLEPDVKGNLK